MSLCDIGVLWLKDKRVELFFFGRVITADGFFPLSGDSNPGSFAERKNATEL